MTNPGSALVLEGAEERLRGRWQEAAAGRTPTWCTVYHAYVVCMHDILLASSNNTLASILVILYFIYIIIFILA